MSRSYSIDQLAKIVGGTLRGGGHATINGVAAVSDAQPDQATWVLRPHYAKQLASSRAGVVLVPDQFPDTPMPSIRCPHLERSVAALLDAFAQPSAGPDPGIHPTAVVHASARIGPNPAIGPHVVIDRDVSIGIRCIFHAGVFVGRATMIGDNCELWPNVVIREGCRLGHRVTIHGNSVIGSDGFGYYRDEGGHRKVPHIGGAILEDDVEIGACTCVDRAKIGHTIIGRGTKIDNLVQIAHNVFVGQHCVLAGQVGISGSVRIGDGCALGGQAGVIDNQSIGDGAQLGARAMVARDIPAGTTVTGWPAVKAQRALRIQALTTRLPELAAQIKDLLARVERLESSAHHSP